MAEKIKEKKGNTNLGVHQYKESGLVTTFWSKDKPNPWVTEVDKLTTKDLVSDYRATVQACRFYYRRDPLAASVINKMIDIAMSPLKLIQGDVDDNPFRVYESLLESLQVFSEDCALEYLVSGLLIPETDFGQATKLDLEGRGIKKYTSLSLPESLWVRDAESIEINSPLIGSGVSYFLTIPESVIFFVQNKGKYKEGGTDVELYNEIVALYPEMVQAISRGDTKLLLDNPYVVRRRVLTDSPYPTPFLYPALESLKHKRSLRQMDYSIAARVITAIMHIKVGDKDFPLIYNEDEGDPLLDLKTQMKWRNSIDDTEKVFQLFTNHTVDISWVFPDTSALLDDIKYKNVNADIFNALGFPKILVTGESERTQSSEAEIALISPTITMNNLRDRIIVILRKVIEKVAKDNKFTKVPEIVFSPMNLQAFSDYLDALMALYDTGNLSREDYLKIITNLDFKEQMQKRKNENTMMMEMKVPEFAPQPHSNTPGTGSEGQNND